MARDRITPACPFCANDHNPDITCRVAAIEGEFVESINSKEMTLADATEELFAMEKDARAIADSIYNLAKRMEKAGLPAQSLLHAMVDVCAVGAAFGLTGDIALLSVTGVPA